MVDNRSATAVLLSVNCIDRTYTASRARTSPKPIADVPEGLAPEKRLQFDACWMNSGGK